MSYGDPLHESERPIVPTINIPGYDDRFVHAEIVEERPRPRRVLLPVFLYIATCISTFVAYFLASGAVWPSLMYAAALMTILTAHELGHFFQALRYHVPASLPYFIPVPLPPLGTMGAVIGMSGRMPNRKALFDIGISGPLAGFVPALVFTVMGLRWSTIVPAVGNLGDPLIFKVLTFWMFGPLPPGHDILIHPLAYAGWVGFLITAVNLFPIGQLDGGHILYAILRRKAHVVATLLLIGAIVAVIALRIPTWSLMLLLMVFMGPKHPPTINDEVPLGLGRTILGWLTLMFLVIGFTPDPFRMGG